jgi:hypothetical protein
MTEGNEIYYALAGTTLGVGLFFEAFRKFGIAKRIKNTPTSKIRALTNGYREIAGRITKGKSTLKAPMSGKRCVYYSFVVTEGSGGQEHERVLIRDEKRIRCSIYDGTGSADIDLNRVKLLLDNERHETSGILNSASSELEATLKKYKKTSKGWVFNKSLKYKETVLEVGDEIYALGPVTVNKGIRRFKGHGLIVSDKSERDVRQHYSNKASAHIFFGVVSFVVSYLVWSR